MFVSSDRTPIPYSDPWELSLEERIEGLVSRECRIAYFYERPDTSTFRYRIFNMAQALDAAPDLGISASWFSRADLPRSEHFIDRADALVICRASYNAAMNRMVAYAKARGIPVLFDVDDLVFNTDYAQLILDTLDQPYENEAAWNHWFAYIGRIGGTLRLCDGAIVTNDFLAERVKEFAPWMVPQVVPNFLNRVQQKISRQIMAAKQISAFERDDKIHIGYFSGTPTHNWDFEIAESALASLLDQDPRLIVRMVGFLEPRGPMVKHRDRIEIYPLQDFLNLQRLIGESEINIAPLQVNTFTNCKSELKYFEAAIVGTLTIATPTYTFCRAIKDGENGFLAQGHEWKEKIQRAVGIVDHIDEYAALADAAYTLAENSYGWNVYADRIAAAVFPGESAIPRPDKHRLSLSHSA